MDGSDIFHSSYLFRRRGKGGGVRGGGWVGGWFELIVEGAGRVYLRRRCGRGKGARGMSVGSAERGQNILLGGRKSHQAYIQLTRARNWPKPRLKRR